MKNTKLTPKNRKEIINRVSVGEKQKDIAKEFGVSPAYISQVVAHERRRQRSDEAPRTDLRSLLTEHLQNRFIDLRNQESDLLEQRRGAQMLADSLRKNLMTETGRFERATTEAEKRSHSELIAGYRGRLTFLESDTQFLFELEKIYRELAGVIAEFRRRGDVLKLF